MTSKIIRGIAERLRMARKQAGFPSAKQFANSLDIPLTTYCQHETGKRCISTELLLLYSKKLKIHPYWLLTGEEVSEPV